MQTVAELLADHPFFRGIDADALALIEGCTRVAHFRRDAFLFREADAADQFFLLRSGHVALECVAPGRTAYVLDTIPAGGVVGWSWLVPPYRWFCDGRATEDVSALSVDGACLRGKCEENPALGYALLQRVTHLMYERLQSARVRLQDLYGVPSGS
jgi:CRP/FNR family transcriptional regulator, cyclic AMP receptor protein